MKVLLSELEAGQKVDEWYSLGPVNITNKVEGGSLRVSVRYLHEIIMPLKEYTSLKEVSACSAMSWKVSMSAEKLNNGS
jgi:Ras GTPase-activating protein 1